MTISDRYVLGAQLFVQNWNVVVVLGLVEVARDWNSQLVFFSEFVDLEAATVVAWAVS